MKPRFSPWLALCLALLGAASPWAQQGQVGNVNDDFLVERASAGADGKLYLWDKQGNVVEGWPKDLGADGRFFSFRPRLADVDFDLKEEIIAVSQRQGGADLLLHVFKGNGQEIKSWRFEFPVKDLIETPLIADVNHDSILDFVFVSAKKGVYVHSQAPNFPRVAAFGAGENPLAAVGDPDNNGRPDLFVVTAGEVQKWNPLEKGLEPVSLPTAEETLLGPPVFTDVSGDGIQEMIYATSANRIVAAGQNKNWVLNIPAPGGETFASGVILEDVDLDREPEILVLTQTQKILAFELNGTPVGRWAQPLLYRQPLPGGGIVADDIYRGLFSSAGRMDLYEVYRNRLGSYSRIYLGENVHDFDERAEFLFARPVEISDVTVFPQLITPNRDGVNDFNSISYRLSGEALITLELYDNHERFLSVLQGQRLRQTGLNEERFEGINTNESVTLKDDLPLDTGSYVLKLVARSREGLTSSAKVLVLVNGLKAEIESPPEGALVHGEVSILGTAIDPNIGEGNLNADFRAYKLYYRPGVWNVTPEEAAEAGTEGSTWFPVPVPSRNQCRENPYKENNDSFFPDSNISCRPVQHGLLGVFDTANAAVTPNGEYTILLKTLDGNGNNPAKISYDTAAVQVHNALANDPLLFDEGDIFNRNNPNNPIYRGPRLVNVASSSARITREAPETIISYSIEGETSDIHIDIHSLAGGELGPAVSVYSFNRQGEGSYEFSWRGQNTLGRNVDGGRYRVRITANAIDGTGVEINESLELDVERGFSSRDILSITAFQATPNSFNPLGFGRDLRPEKTTLSYALSKEAKVTLQVFDQAPEQGGRLLKTLLGGRVERAGSVSWDGTGANGLVLPAGEEYTVRLTAEGIDIGNEERVRQDIPVHLFQGVLDPRVDASLVQLVGDESRGERFDNDGETHVLQGNSDFKWRVRGRGYLEVPFDYWLRAYGVENYDNFVTTEASGLLYFCLDVCQGIDCMGNPQWERAREDSLRNVSVSVPAGSELTNFDIRIDGTSADIIADNFIGIHEEYNLDNGSRLYSQPFPSPLRNNSTVSFSGRSTDKNCFSRPSGPCGMNGTLYQCGTMTVSARGGAQGQRNWPLPGQSPPFIDGNLIVPSIDNNGAPLAMPIRFRDYNGQIGSGQEDTIPGTVRVTHYELEAENEVNGISVRLSNDNRGIVVLPGVKISRVGGDKSSGNLQVETVGNGGNRIQIYETNLHDPFLANAPFNKIHGMVSQFNRDRFQRITPQIRIFDQGYRPNILQDQDPGVTLYTFSDVVRIASWEDLELRYPNISVDKPDGDNLLNAGNDPLNIFALEQVHVEPPGTKERTNKNVDDWFQLRLLPEAQPKRFVEIWGSAQPDYELYYYDTSEKEPAWHPIPPRTHNVVTNDILAHWDVTKLNGRHYTVVLKSFDPTDPNRRRMNQDTFAIGIGTEVDTSQIAEGERKEVCSTFRRSCLSFGAGALEEPALITINAVPREEADFELPNGIAPIGPIFDVAPDGLEINPARPVQLDLVFTPEEMQDTFGVGDPSEVTIYYLAGDNMLEALATVWILDTGDNDNPFDDVYRFTAYLDHFSQYLLGRKNFGQFHIQSPSANERLKGTVAIRGLVEREASAAPGEVGEPSEVARVSIQFYPVLSPLSKVELFSGDRPAFALDWETTQVEDGNYILLFEAQNQEGQSTRYEMPVTVDNTGGSSLLFVNGEIVPHGGRVLAGLNAVVEFRSRDDSGIDRLEYLWDGEPPQIYAGPFALPFESGEHLLTYRSVDLNGNPEADRSAAIIAGQQAEGGAAQRMGIPRLVLDGPYFVDEGAEKIWISPATQIRFSDGRHIHYYFNEVPKLFEEPFTLESNPEGLYNLTFFSADEFGRRGTTRSQKLVLDKTAPVTTLRFEGPHLKNADSVIVIPETEIYFEVSDQGRLPSGRKKIEYQVNEGPWVPHLGLARPLIAGALCGDLAASFDACLFSWRATDQVDNQEGVRTLRIQLDDEIPLLEISDFPKVISPNGDGRHDTIAFSVWSRDNFSKNLSLEFGLTAPDGGTISVYDARPLEGEGPVYSVSWGGLKDGAPLAENQYTYSLAVKDERGNRSAVQSGKLTYDLTPPDLTIEEGNVLGFSPNGDEVSDILNVRYRVQDNLFDENIQVDLNVNSVGGFPVKQKETLVSIPPDTHELQWDGKNAVENPSFDGVYRFALVAKDPAGNVSEPVSAEVNGEAQNVVVDRLAPATRLTMEGPHYFSDADILWVGPNAQFRLQASDPFPASGVREIWATFLEPARREPVWATFRSDAALFVLPQPRETFAYELHYYALDLVGNREALQTKGVRYDQTPPRVSHTIGEPKIGVPEAGGEGITRVSPRTLFTLEGRDNEGGSGLRGIRVEMVEDGARFDYSETFYLQGLPDGRKTIRFWGEDHVSNRSQPQTIPVDYDATAPRTELILGLPNYVEGERTFVTSATRLSLQATAEREDLERSEYRFHRQDPEDAWRLFESPFQLPEERGYDLRFRSIDVLENQEPENSKMVIVDNTAPDPEMLLSQGQGGEYVTRATRITLGGERNGAGIVSLFYRIDGGEWKEYQGPFDLSGLAAGPHVIEYYSVDRLGNRSASRRFVAQLINLLVEREDFALPRTLVWLLPANPREPLAGANGRFLSGLLEEMGGYYKIATDSAQFHELLRSDRFTTYILAADVNQYQFEENEETLRMFRELKSRIDKGEAFINMAGHARLTGRGWDIFRENWGAGNPAHLQALALVPELARQARVYSWGEGAIVEMLTNVGVLAEGEQGAAPSTAIAELIHSVRPHGEELHAGEVVDTRLQFTNSADIPVTVEVEEIYPEGSRIETRATGREVDVQQRVYQVEVEALGSWAVDYLYRFPPVAGRYVLTANIDARWGRDVHDRVSLESSYEVKEDEVEELIAGGGEPAPEAGGAEAGKSVAKAVTLAKSEEREAKIDRLLDRIDATPRNNRAKQLQLDEAVESVQVAQVTAPKADAQTPAPADPAPPSDPGPGGPGKINEPSSFGSEHGLGSGGCQMAEGSGKGGVMAWIWFALLAWLLVLRGIQRRVAILTAILLTCLIAGPAFAQSVTPVNASNGAGMGEYGMFDFLSNQEAVNVQNGNLVFQKTDFRLPGPLGAGLYRSYNIGVGPMVVQRFIDIFEGAFPHTVPAGAVGPPTIDRIVYENTALNLGPLGTFETKNTSFDGGLAERFNNEIAFKSGRSGWQVNWAPVVGVVFLLNVSPNAMERPAVVLLVRQDGSAEPFDFLTGESLWNKAGPRFETDFGETPENVDALQNLVLREDNKTYHFTKTNEGTSHYQAYYSYPCERWAHFGASFNAGFQSFSLTQTTCHADYRLPGWKAVGFLLYRMEDNEGHWAQVDNWEQEAASPQTIRDEAGRFIARRIVAGQENVEEWETGGGRVWEIEYDAEKRILNHTDPSGNTTRFGYDLAAGVLCPACPPQVRNLGWENLVAPAKFVQIDYPSGGTLRYEWFGEERPVGVENPGGNTYVIVTEFPDPNNAQVAHQKYHWINHVTQDDGENQDNQQFVQNPLLGATEVSEERIQSTLYDLDGSVKTQVFRKIRGDFKLVRETTLGGNNFSLVKNHIWNLNTDGKRVNGVGALNVTQGGLSYTEFSSEYDPLGRTAAAIAPNGLRTEYRYVADAGPLMNLVAEIRKISGNAVEVTRHTYGGTDVCGREIRDHQFNYASVERNGQEKILKKICYDNYGNPVRELPGDAWKQQLPVQFSVDANAQAPEGHELRVYDNITGWLAREVDPHGVATRYTYTPTGLLSRADYAGGSYMAHEYDLANRRMATTYFDATTGRQSSVVRRFDGLGSVLEEDVEGEVTRYSYNPAKKMRTMVYPDGREVLYEYDAMGRILEQTLSGHETIRYDYAVEMLDGEPVNVTRTRIGGRNIVTVKNDLSGNLVLLEKYQENNQPVTTRYHYDPFGNLLRVDTPQGLHVQDAIDYATGAVVRTFPGGDEKRFNMFEAENGSSITERDAGGNAVTARLNFDPSSGLLQNIALPGQSVQMNYGNEPLSRNRLTQVTDDSGSTRFAYNRGGAPEMVEREVNALSKRFAFYQVQDSFGKTIRLIYPNGLIVYYKYDRRGRIEEVRKDSETGLTLACFEYEGSDQPSKITYANGVVNQFAYDIGGRVTRMETKKADGSWTQQDEYTYDGRGRKVGVRHLDGSRKEYDYDGLNQLKAVRYFKNEAEAPFQFQEYEYDLDGNRTVYRDGQKSVRYSYEDGKLVGYEIEKEGGALWQGSVRYERGNMVEQVERRNGKVTLEKHFTYDPQNRLVQADVNDRQNKFETSSTYQYDYTGRRESVTVDGKTTYYLYGQAGDPLMEVGGEGEVDAFFIFVGTRRLAKIAGDNLDFYHQDEMDNVLKMTDADGEEVLSARYDPFGAASFLSGSAHTPFLFAGKPYDQTTGLIYFGGRYYDPSLGRFLTRDPLLSGINPYIYSGNNPIQNKEVFGLWGFHLSIGISFDLKGVVPGAGLTFTAGPITLGVNVSTLLTGGASSLMTNLTGSIDLGPISLDLSFKDFTKQSLWKSFAGSLSSSLMKSVKLPGPLGKLAHPLMMAGGLTFGTNDKTGKLEFGFKFADIGGKGNFLDARDFMGLARKLGDFVKDPGIFFKALNFKPGGFLAESLEGMASGAVNPVAAVLTLGQRLYTRDFSIFDFTGSFGTIDPYSTEGRWNALLEAAAGAGEEAALARALIEEANIPPPEADQEVGGMERDEEEPAKQVAQNSAQPTTGNKEEDKKMKTDRDGSGGDPVLLHNGELLVEESDLKIPGRGIDFAFKRTYRSRIRYAGPLGHNWDHNYNKRLVERENGKIARFDGDARFDLYERREDGGYKSPAGYFDTLTKKEDGSYEIRDKSGTLLKYSADGFITEMNDRNANRVTFEYELIQDPLLCKEGPGEVVPCKRLITVIDPLGRRIVFSYDNQARLARVTDFAGRGVGFEYDQHGDLIHAYDPLNNKVTYFYSAGYGDDRAELNHNIIRIKDAKDQIYLENEYSIYDRVVRQRFGNHGHFTMSYHQIASSDDCTGERIDQTAYRTRFTDRKGHVIDYLFNCQGNMLSITRYTNGARPAEPQSYTTIYRYNEDGLVLQVTQPRGNGITYVYDAKGNVIEKTDLPVPGMGAAGPLTTRYTYDDPFSQVTSIADPLQRVSHFSLDDRGNVTRKCLPLLGGDNAPPPPAGGGQGEVICETYAYNAHGQLTSQTDGEGLTDAYEYDPASGALTAIVTDAGEGGLRLTRRFGYDAAGNITSFTGANGNLHRFEVDPLNRVTREVAPAPLNYERRFEYDVNGNLVHLFGNSAVETLFTYNELDRVATKSEMSEENGAPRPIVTEYQYDLNENVARVIQPEGNSVCIAYDERDKPWQVTKGCRSEFAATQEFYYDPNGNLARRKDGMGHSVRYEYDPFDRLAKVTDPLNSAMELSWDDAGNITEMTRKSPSPILGEGGGEGFLARTEFNYDDLNRLIRRVQHNEPQNAVTTYAYDNNHRVVGELDPNNNNTLYLYDGADRLAGKIDALGNTAEYNYDGNGNVTRVESVEGPERFAQTFEYDAENRLTRRQDNLGHAFTYRYDSRGNLVETTDPKDSPGLDTGPTQGAGNKRLYFYDGLNRLIRESKELRTGGAGSGGIEGTVTTNYAYDDNGRMTSISDDNQHATTFAYDPLDRQIGVTLPNDAVYAKRYDRRGNLVEEISPNGYKVASIYDAAGRLSRKRIWLYDAPAGREEYNYDGLSRMVSAQTVDPFGNAVGKVEFAYDKLNRLLREGVNGRAMEKSYDPAGNVVERRYPSGRTYRQEVDGLNRLTRIMEGNAEILNVRHRGLGRVGVERLGNGLETTFGYDAVKRLISMEMRRGGNAAPVYAYSYGYDKAGNRLFELVESADAPVPGEPPGAAPGATVYSYDSLNRLIRSREGVANPAAEIGQPGSQPYEVLNEWELDGVDNWLQRIQSLPFVRGGEGGVDETVQRFDPNEVNEYTNIDGQAFVYDANGNLIEDATRRYQYNYRNLLTRVVNKADATEVAAYGYDPLGRRIYKTVAGAGPAEMTRYVYEGVKVIAELEQDANGGEQIKREFIYGEGIDDPVAMVTLAGYHYYHSDAQGSVIMLTDSQGNTTEKYKYDAYGDPEITDASTGAVMEESAIGNPHLYTGQRYDPETGFYYYKARYYHPQLGRFLQRDPLGYIDGYNLYAYVNNNPLNFVDPMGHYKIFLPAIHEAMTLEAAKLAGVTNRFAVSGLIQGVRWNDIPQGEVVFAFVYKGKIEGNTTYDTHFGSKQYWHFMKNDGETAQQVLGKVLNQSREWYDQSLKYKNKAEKSFNFVSNIRNSTFFLGHIIHVIQDSFSPGHVLRDSNDDSIVDIYNYRDQYDSGKEHEHSGYDKQYSNKAVATTAELIKLWNNGAEWSEVQGFLKRIFRLKNAEGKKK